MSLPLDQVKVIDADTHMTEQHDLWTKRAPAAWKDRVPHVTQVDGAATWVVDGAVLGRAGAGGVVDKNGVKGRTFEGLYEWEIEQAHAAAYDPVARVELMDDIGVWAQIVYPGVVGLGGQNLASLVEDVALRTVCLEIFNDANAELQAESGNRLLPMALLPGVGRRPVRARGAPGEESRPARRQPHRRPARRRRPRPREPRRGIRSGRRAARWSLPVHFHIGASLTTMNYFGTYPWDSHDDDTKLAIGGALLFIGNARVVVNIICTGHARPVPGAQDRLGRERRGLDPVHPRGARLRDDRERAAREGRARRCCPRSTSSVRSTRPRGSSAPTCRRSSRRSARTTSCSRPTTRTRRACIPTR